jgi:tRNA threonylcarbamoyladenosine biosynthesis protein TsaB
MSEPLILHIETSTNICSVALSQGRNLLALKESDEQKAHSTLLTVFVDQLLTEVKRSAEAIDAVCVSKGPGSYTGLRIGVSVTKGLAYGLNVPVIGITSLHAMARGALDTALVREHLKNDPGLLLCPMIDARRMEVYTAFFDKEMNELRPTHADIIDSDSYSGLLRDHKVLFFGNGAFKLKDVVVNDNVILMEDFHPSARHMIVPALEAYARKAFEDTAYFEPFYLKDFIATTPRKKVL